MWRGGRCGEVGGIKGKEMEEQGSPNAGGGGGGGPYQ